MFLKNAGFYLSTRIPPIVQFELGLDSILEQFVGLPFDGVWGVRFGPHKREI